MTVANSSEVSSLGEELQCFREEMQQTREEFRAFREELRNIRTLVSKCDARLHKLENTVQTILESQVQYGSQGFKSEILKLESTVNLLQVDLNDRDQELLANDFELSGIPEESGENRTHLVLTVATKLDIHLEEGELVNCMRVGGARQDTTSRPRPIVVRLARRDVRDDVLRAAHVRRSLTTEALGLKSAPCNIYINERLTCFAWHARHAASRNGVCLDEGRRIFARRKAGAPINRIRFNADIA
ncbi:unnamed protein product [Parnassius apollo]|uniref:(apollo) hypothetical protein n=1 Tax=Parnassius apollo TaxID=110799 RepID=A0A8S3WVE1_PARAO|nr:unnamed protein product [Parnassius apollo]